MKIIKKENRIQEFTILVRRTCDLCGKDSQGGDGTNWSRECYDIDETQIHIEIKAKRGAEYPEGGSGTEIEIDLCPGCFRDKLIPWLKSQGVKINEREWSW